MLKTLSAATAALALAAIAGPSAAAGLFDGKTLQVSYLYPDTGSAFRGPDDIIGGGPAVTWNIGSSMSVTLAGNTVTAVDTCYVGCIFDPVTFNGLRLTDTYGVLAPITGVSINAASNFPAFDLSRVTFDSDNVYLNFQGLTFETNPAVFAVDVQTSGGAIPEPSTWALLLAGFGLAGLGLRRRTPRLA